MSSRKRKRQVVVQPQEEEEDEDQPEEEEEDEEEDQLDETDAEDEQKAQEDKENEVWEAIREERYEIVEQLPLTLQRQLSLMKQLDEQSQGYLEKLMPTLRNYIELRRKLEQTGEEAEEKDTDETIIATPPVLDGRTVFSVNESTTMPIPRERMRAPHTSREHLSHIAWLSEELLRASQEKINLAQATNDSVDRHIRLLDAAIQEQEALLASSEQGTIHLPDLTLPKSARGADVSAFDKYNSITLQTSGLQHERADDDENSISPVDEVGIPREVMKAMFISPTTNEAGEELYCYCNRVSFGEMIACDGPQCGLEWFHLGCVGLLEPPAGEWFCENCTKFDA